MTPVVVPSATTATPSVPSDVVLDVQGLCLDLRRGSMVVPVVSDVSFRVREGEVLGVVGESGSGKSLTALSVMRMLPAAATAVDGRVLYRGRDVLAMASKEVTALRGGEVGIVFQDPMAFLNPLMTVGRQIREALHLHGVSRSAAAKRAVELLDLVGVRNPSKRAEDYPHQFSGGMRQRVMIAMAVANNPSLLIADEPTTALDVTVQAGILRLLLELRDEFGMALVLITHDIGVVEDVCDQVMVMYAGRVVEQGRVLDVLHHPSHPYTGELMRSAPRLDVPVQRRLYAIAGQPPDVAHRPSGCPFHPRCPLAVEKCRETHPPLALLPHDLRLDGPGQLVACWRAGDPIPAGPAGLPAAGQIDAAPGLQPILDIRDVTLSYQQPSWWSRADSSPPVVDGVSLQVHPGRTLGLVGESGSGKSTLARAIVGLVPIRSGQINIDGLRWDAADRRQRAHLRRTVQMVFQDPYQSLDPRQTIRDILTEPIVVHRLARGPGLTARVDQLMSRVGLSSSLLDSYPYQLSGGQRQRVGIARALAVEPRLIVADEPVSALDVSVQAQIINLLADLRDDLGLALLVIAHDLSVVRHLCEDVAVMQSGRILEQGSKTAIFEHPAHPYTVSLLAATPGSHGKAGS